MRKFTIFLAIFLAVVIVALLGILIFVKPAKAPVVMAPVIVTTNGLEVSLPHLGDTISSPVAIEGTVTGGGWFFEGSFPIKILDGDGKEIGHGIAQALSDWTSTGTVPFSASLSFTPPHSATGTILFQNDNPSGSPANEKSFSVPVAFK